MCLSASRSGLLRPNAADAWNESARLTPFFGLFGGLKEAGSRALFESSWAFAAGSSRSLSAELWMLWSRNRNKSGSANAYAMSTFIVEVIITCSRRSMINTVLVLR